LEKEDFSEQSKITQPKLTGDEGTRHQHTTTTVMVFELKNVLQNMHTSSLGDTAYIYTHVHTHLFHTQSSLAVCFRLGADDFGVCWPGLYEAKGTTDITVTRA